MCSWLLKNASTYNPDTLDLSQDAEAAAYWFPCFRELMKKFSTQAAINQRQDDITADQRAEQCCVDFYKILDQYEAQLGNKLDNNCALSIRILLDLLESKLREHGFPDAWFNKKQIENEAAMALFEQRLLEIDAIVNMDERWTELIRGVIAGNMFDYGAGAVCMLLRDNPDFGLAAALESIEQRPWLIDDLELLLIRFRRKKPHKCAAIFVDNSGVDIILGILPFARELIRQGTKVLLCANSEPSLNDVTAYELTEILNKRPCIELADAWTDHRLLVFENGQRGPCLDMRTLPLELNEAMRLNDTDLLIIEGMGRALHTNFYTTFNCDTLKLFVIKNEWLAQRLGGKTFSAICKYEPVNKC